jgi:putative inorganic carbon (HCO3(-)) transporter
VLWLLFLAASRRRGGVWLYLLALMLLATTGVAWLGPERLQNLWQQNLTVAPSGQASWSALAARPEIWSRALYALQDFPWTGLGMNMFRRQAHTLYPYATIAAGADLGHAHNQFLQAGVDLGLPGLIAYVALWLVSGLALAHAWRAAASSWARWLSAGLSAALLGSFVFGLTDAVALGARPGFVWWMMLGVVTALPTISIASKTALQ